MTPRSEILNGDLDPLAPNGHPISGWRKAQLGVRSRIWSKAMLYRSLLGFLVAIIATALVAKSASASTVTSSTNTAGGVTTITYTVTAQAGENIRDFHILPPATSSSTIKGTLGGGPAGWVNSAEGKNANWRAGSQGAAVSTVANPANNPATFTLSFPEGGYTVGQVRWATTNDNNMAAATGQIDAGPGEGEPTTNGPLSSIVVVTDDVTYGATNLFVLTATELSQDYELYAVGTLSGMPDPGDYASFVSWAASNPVHSGWGLSFGDMTGTLNGSGFTNAPDVVVPNNPSLANQVFYVVAYVETVPDDVSASYMVASEVRTITIVAP